MTTNELKRDSLPGKKLDIAKMPGHWLLARMGKRVLRPGGIEMTHTLLRELEINTADTVVEMAPGLGATAQLALESNPAHYIGVERDEVAASQVRKILRDRQDRCVLGNAAATGLANESASVVYGEAMLTMQTTSQKSQIVREAFRVLRPGGRYGIHELGLRPDDLSDEIKDKIRKELSSAINVGARPLTLAEWSDVLRDEGFEVQPSGQQTAPMHLLERSRMIQDEGLLGAMRIAFNILRTPAARRRIFQMRKIFRRYEKYLCAVCLIATKPNSETINGKDKS